MKTIKLQADLCVIGGGLAGMCTALAAARHGLSVVLMHDRPVLGGNASGEIRMWVCGAQGPDCRETGILEEIMMENHFRNPRENVSIWDSILYGKLQYSDRIRLLLNTSCLDAGMADGRIAWVKGWQSLSQLYYEVEAPYFADCSGDSILAALTPAIYRSGREARSEFNENIEPEAQDPYTMGSSCLMQLRESDREIPFRAPEWAAKYRRKEDLPPNRDYNLYPTQNFWYIEVGGKEDVIHDAEAHRERLLKIVFGLWDYMKNYAENRNEFRNWELDWVGFLPGKRESRRYVGDYIVSQNDVATGGNFPDIIAYGGWSMDDHNPGGFEQPGLPTVFHQVTSPFGIPYRAIYSTNIPNLFFAGRNISLTHAALAAARVMGTCAAIGQAAGTAAALAKHYNTDPRGVGEHIGELQQMLMDDDCWLPGLRRNIPELTREAMLNTSNSMNPEAVRDGIDRNRGDELHIWQGENGDWLEYSWNTAKKLHSIRMVFDSDLNRSSLSTVAVRYLNRPDLTPPASLVRNFRIDFRDENGVWHEAETVSDNYQRLVRIELSCTANAVRLTFIDGWGNDKLGVFAFDVQ